MTWNIYSDVPSKVDEVAAALAIEHRKDHRRNVLTGLITILVIVALAIWVGWTSHQENRHRLALWAQPVGSVLNIRGTLVLVTAYDRQAHKYNGLALSPQPVGIILDPDFVHTAWESSQTIKEEK